MRSDDGDPGNRLAAAGWRQGKVIDQEGLATLQQGSFSCGIVLSQDCDLVQGIELEPQAEIILGQVCESARADCVNGRNPRRLDIEMAGGSRRAFASLKIIDRVQVDKRTLMNVTPSAELVLDRESTSLLIEWVAKRYTRPAWPDAFNARLEAVDRKLERLFKSDSGKVIGAILFALDPAEDELEAEHRYRLAVWLTIDRRAADSTQDYKSALEFEARLKEILESCAGIELLHIDLRSEADVSLEDLRHFRRFDRDYRSWGANPSGARSPAG